MIQWLKSFFPLKIGFRSVNVERLRPSPLTLRRGPDQWLDLLTNNIRGNGVRCPIIVNRRGIILDGERRWNAAKKIGLKTVPVHVVNVHSTEEMVHWRTECWI